MIKREHLIERLRSNLGLSATFICAGPGWGKTTAAATMLETVERPSVWYDVDSSDADVGVFFQYLVRALRRVAPGFGRGTLEMVASGTGTRVEQLADLFLYELSEDVRFDVIIVLDNLHHVFPADWSAPLLYRILQLLPENIHLMMLARSVPPFTFSRMRSKQSMDHLDDRALAFTREEAMQLMEGVLDDAATVATLLDRTQGWVAGLQIIRQALESDRELRQRDIDNIITRSETEIFDYFAQKIYSAEPPEVRALLIRSALPRHVTPEVLSEALGVSISLDQLQAVVRENIFLSRVAGEVDTFIYHPLFRDFLCKQLEEETTPPERARMRLSLARYYASKESWELALQNFFEAGAEDGAAETLLAAQRQLLANGLTLTVSKYFPRFSDRTLNSHPQLYNLMGDMQVIEGNTVRADSMYRSAIVAARSLDDASAEAAALAGLAHTAARDHNFKDAIRYAEEAGASPPLKDLISKDLISKDLISQFASQTIDAMPDESTLRITLAARVKNVIGAVRAFEGRYTEATVLMEEALRLAHEAGEARLVRTISHNLALPAYMEGDFPAALRYFSRSPISDRDGGRAHPDSITLYLNRAAIYTARGELEPAERDIERASEVTEIFNLRGFLPRILEARGNIARERLDFDEAARLYNGALDEYRRTDADPVKTDLYYERALLELRRREYEEALDLINLMLEDRRAFGRDIEEAIARQMRGRILVARSDARAISDADAGEPLLRRLHCNYYLAISCYLKSRALADRDSEGGRRALLEFVSLAERFDYSYFITCEESFYPSLAKLCELYSVSSEWLNRVLSGAREGVDNATNDYERTEGLRGEK
ncbi:MAG TPA: hypothetical protein VNH22_19670 [Blastocatellia bacterium]|jgi:ATP/maltotriose-dependent transcriptional regulator MalT|nr:hypothetical protein [Blastocatellia bacterium]